MNSIVHDTLKPVQDQVRSMRRVTRRAARDMSGVADDIVGMGRSAARSTTRLIEDQPLLALAAAFAAGLALGAVLRPRR